MWRSESRDCIPGSKARNLAIAVPRPKSLTLKGLPQVAGKASPLGPRVTSSKPSKWRKDWDGRKAWALGGGPQGRPPIVETSVARAEKRKRQLRELVGEALGVQGRGRRSPHALGVLAEQPNVFVAASARAAQSNEGGPTGGEQPFLRGVVSEGASPGNDELAVGSPEKALDRGLLEGQRRGRVLPDEVAPRVQHVHEQLGDDGVHRVRGLDLFVLLGGHVRPAEHIVGVAHSWRPRWQSPELGVVAARRARSNQRDLARGT